MRKLFNRAFNLITPAQMAVEELAEAERLLLTARSAVEWAQSQVAYNESRVKRLRKYLANSERTA